MKPSDLYPRLKLLPYQSAFAANSSRFKIGLWARQTGKDHTATAEAVIDCLFNPGTTWIILAASERQALESLAKAKDWAAILNFQIDDYEESPDLDSIRFGQSGSDPQSAIRDKSQLRFSKAEIQWSNGSRLIALPANPQTVRGYSANLILTEFAFHENADAIWRAIYPSISNPLRGGLKKLRIISTPNGLNNKFADLWLNTPTHTLNLLGGANVHVSPDSSSPFVVPSSDGSPSAYSEYSVVDPSSFPQSQLQNPKSHHDSRSEHLLTGNTFVAGSGSQIYFKSKITIHDAIKYGLPLNPDELRAGLNDDDAWSQEYLCEFMDSSSVMFPYDLIAPCESESATESLPTLTHNHTPTPSGPSFVVPPLGGSGCGPLYAGIDFGRKHNLTVCWILERLPASAGIYSASSPVLFITREVLCLKNTPTPEQLEILRPRLQRCRKISLDYTGAGIGLGDYILNEFGGGARPPGAPSSGRIDLCQFTPALKAELFPRLRAAFEQRSIRIPISREIREDLHAIQRTVTQSGQINYRAPHTPDGHSDRTTALALALRAATSAPPSACATSISVPGRTADLRWARNLPRVSRLRRRGFWF